MKNWKQLSCLLWVNNLVKAGLISALLLLTFRETFAQQYFNYLYKEGLTTYNVLSLENSYFLPAQVWSTEGKAAILTMCIDSIGGINQLDTFSIIGRHIYPGMPSSIHKIGKSIYNTGSSQFTSSDSQGVLFKLDSNNYNLLSQLVFQDSIITVLYASTVGNQNRITSVGYIFRHVPNGQSIRQHQLLLMQLDTLGNKLWERSYPAKAGLWHLQGNTVISTKDGGFAVGGSAYNYAVFPSYTSYVLLTDSLGNKLNERYLKFENYGNYSMGLTELPNGNFLVAYATTYKSFPASADLSRKLIALELDKNDLSTIWQKEYLQGYLNGLVVSRLIPQNDSTYLIAGTYHPDPILYQGDYANQLGFIFAINNQGDSLWYRDYSNQTDSFEYNFLNDIAVTPDGGIVGAGRLETPNSPYTGGLANHVWLFKTDSIGCLYVGCDTVYDKPKPPVTEFKVYPNPIQNGQDLIIELPNATIARAYLFNTIGQRVYQKELEFVSGTAYLPLKEVVGGRTGVYLLQLTTPCGKTYVKKIVLY